VPEPYTLRPAVFLDRDGTLAVYYCPHALADNCNCLKPKTGMLERAALEPALDLQHSFVVGDRYNDIELARNVRARVLLIRTGYEDGRLAGHGVTLPLQPDFVAKDLSHAAGWILRQPR
jgi:histidinol phosphatase-like enzyme